ncbi:unnamed protein product [Staurois parvus]|uniref:Uncharacterized protein n=1 Tax=Staurois parvus TaxID=386267 RepID=A0ABN9H305_9NEOB|nr:unnamed protein product [Staurois parvus]
MRSLKKGDRLGSKSFWPYCAQYKCVDRGGLTIWKLGHCPRARGR